MSVHYGAAMQLAVEQSKGKMPPQAKLLGAILMDNYLMGRTPAGEPFAVQAWDAPSVAIPLRGTGGLRQRLAADLATAAAGSGWLLTLPRQQPASSARATKHSPRC